MSAQCFVSSIYDPVGRLFKDEKHLPPSLQQTHLGLLSDFSLLDSGSICLRPKEGKLESIYERLISRKTRKPREASLAEVMQIAGILIFVLLATLVQTKYDLFNVPIPS